MQLIVTQLIVLCSFSSNMEKNHQEILQSEKSGNPSEEKSFFEKTQKKKSAAQTNTRSNQHPVTRRNHFLKKKIHRSDQHSVR
jgi:hypothetical protein